MLPVFSDDLDEWDGGGGSGGRAQRDGSWGFPGGSDGKESPAVQETQLQSLGQEDPLEKGMVTHSSIFA